MASNGSSKSFHAETASGFDVKLISFVAIGVLTLVYTCVEIGVGIYVPSLVLLSDGFHNLSDVISLIIAYWAQSAQKRASSDAMSYGWGRSELLGGLTNGSFLLALCLYIALESIPKLINPQPMEGGLLFVIIAASGLAVNTIGTIVFAITGQAHSHSHSHSHGHSHDDKKKEKKSHGHSHKHEKSKEEKIELLSASEISEQPLEGHSHQHKHDKSHKKKKKKAKPKRDQNVHAVFLHYLGDAISSLMVLCAGLLLHFFDGKWTYFIDPLASLAIVVLILVTTVPLVKRCSMILLQSTPQEINIKAVRAALLKVEGLVSMHDLHVWQFVDGMIIASVHITVEEGADFSNLLAETKRIFHEFGIHSSNIQPEFVPRNFKEASFCVQNCVRECEEEWCCKKSADSIKSIQEEYSIDSPV